MINEFNNRVRYAETDNMGIVYHANYYVWFDMGRVEYLREVGYDYRTIENHGIIFPLIEGHCKYIRPARFDDLVTIKTRITLIKTAKVKFEYEVFNHLGDRLAIGYTVHGMVNKDLKPLNIIKYDKALYDLLKSNVEESIK
jgi:acyl-CoA thioester hydrolase